MNLLARSSLRVKRLSVWLALLAIVGHSFVTGMDELRLNWGSAHMDQGAYLAFGLDLREHGTLIDASSRHPLYPFLLSFLAKRDWSYFTNAKLLTLALALAGLVAIFSLVRRAWGDEAALLAVLFLSVNPAYTRYSGILATEALLTPLFFTAWYLVVRSYSKPSSWPVAGVVAGLVYLTKATGQMLAVAVVLTAVILYRQKALRRRELWLFLAAYALTISPLLIYNTLTTGNPFHQREVANVLWMDHWEQYYIADPKNMPTLGSYLRTHTLGDIVGRLWQGAWGLWAFSVILLMPLGLDARDALAKTPLPLLIAAAVVVLAVVYRKKLAALWRSSPGPATLTATFFFVYFAPFAWYADMEIVDRFPLPLYPIIYLLMALLLARLTTRVVAGARGGTEGSAERRRPPLADALATGGPVALSLALVVWAMATAVPITRQWRDNPYHSDRLLNVAPDSVLARLRADPTGPAVAVWGPSHSLPYWKHTDRFVFRPVPSDIPTMADFNAYLSSIGAKYVILDNETVKRRKEIFGGYFRRTQDRRIEFSALPETWALADLQPGLPCEWCVFRPIAATPIEHPLAVNLGDRIRLLGYDLEVGSWKLEAGNWKPGTGIRLTLYWQATGEIEADYTVFTHLLGPGGLVRGQMDSQPIRGRWPTSRWLPGQIVADRYALTVAADAPPGEYHVEVGMYLLETMERLLVAGDTSGNNAVVLSAITVTD